MTISSPKPPSKGQVVILCGGQGTRMGGTANTVKKELVQIGDRPMIWHVMKIFSTFGFEDYVLPLGHRGEEIRRYFLEYNLMHAHISYTIGEREPIYHQEVPESHWRLTMVNTGLDATKGVRIKRVAQYILSDPFLLTYGDGVGNIDINALVAFHKEHGKAATVTGVRTASQYGLMTVDDHGQVEEYWQYPLQEKWTNAGFMVFNRAVLEHLAEDGSVDLESGLLTRLASQGQLMMYRHDGFWSSADTFREVEMLNDLWNSGKPPWRIW